MVIFIAGYHNESLEMKRMGGNEDTDLEIIVQMQRRTHSLMRTKSGLQRVAVPVDHMVIVLETGTTPYNTKSATRTRCSRRTSILGADHLMI